MKNKQSNFGAKNGNWKGGVTKDIRKWMREYMPVWVLKRKELLAGRKKPKNCEICNSIGNIKFDHDHQSGKFRGWICHRCNVVLGMMHDDKELLFCLLGYLEALCLLGYLEAHSGKKSAIARRKKIIEQAKEQEERSKG